MAGVPRAMYMPYPIQILQTADQILMAFEYASASRMIHLKNHSEAPVASWMGWSNGRWEGDTLVVDVTSHERQLSWLDRAGNYASDTLKVTERYTLQDANHLLYEATLEDPDGILAAVQRSASRSTAGSSEPGARGDEVRRVRRRLPVRHAPEEEHVTSGFRRTGGPMRSRACSPRLPRSPAAWRSSR